jgi:uroporphyrin-III C-methyltransferase / precorrin-2 dehydrogenase / sirohydrochlorin ferrochelatase
VRLEGKPIILIGDGPAADAKRRLLERAGAVIAGEEADAMLAVIANGDEDAADRLRARGILLNVVDRPDLCDFTLPAILDRDPVLIAIGTGGASAGLAAALRQRLEPLLPAGLGKLATFLLGARDGLRARFPDAEVRRRAIGSLLAAGGPLDPLVGHDDPAAALEAAEAAPGRIERIEIASADPDLLTLRAARLLGLADHIHIEGMIPSPILDRARADAQRIAGAPPRVPAPGLTLHLIWKPA